MVVEVASTNYKMMTMIDKDLLTQVVNQLMLNTLLVLLIKLRLKDSEDSSLGQPKESRTCTFQHTMTKLMLEMLVDQSISLHSKMVHISKRRSKESVTLSLDKDMKFQG